MEAELAPLAASKRVDVLHALLQRHFKPAFATILSAEHLAIACRDVDLLGVAVMQTDRHQRAVRRHLVEALPGLTDVLAAVERAVFRRGGNAETSIERVRILRRNLDVAPVGEWREAVDPHVLPGLALILAAEQTHAQGDDDAIGIRGARADGVAVEHAFGLSVADELAPQTRFCLRQAQEVGAAIAPAFAAIGRAHDTRDFEHSKNLAAATGMRCEPHHPAGKRHLGMDGQSQIGHALPALAAVVAAIDRSWRTTG